jgi:hypothetical protein
MPTTQTGNATDFITFSRGSLGTVTDSDGLIKWAPHNLLLASEQFQTTSWTKSSATVTANSIAAPNGTETADTITASGANGTTLQSYTAEAVPYTFGVWLKRKTGTGTIEIAADNGTYTAVTITSDWALYTVTQTPAAGSKSAGIRIVTSADEVYAWGAHLYRSDLGGMQANASAYPYYNPSTPKNLLGYSENYTNTAWVKTDAALEGDGVELVTNGTFDTDISGWTNSSTGTGSISWNASGYLHLTSTDSSNRGAASQSFSTVVGKEYIVQSSQVGGLSGLFRVGTSVGGTQNLSQSQPTGDYLNTFVATATTTYVTIYGNPSGTTSYDNISVQEVATYVSPNGSNNALAVKALAANGTLTQSLSLLASPYTFSIWLKRKTGTGTVEITVDGTTYATAAVTSDWQRFSTTLTPSAGTKTPGIRLVTSGDAVYAWGAQLTDSASLDPYVPNFGAAPSAAAAYGPRLDYDPVTLAARGLLVEEARTNVVLHNSDLTQAAWTASNVTTAKTQTGPDGVANSATLLTATAGNGTVLQAITLASSARFQSAYVKRVTGTGTIEMTMDNGSTWIAVAVTSSWTRVSIPSATITNPTVGFRIVTSGDEIAVWGVQNETGAFATSVIPTAAATVTRNADVATVGVSQFPYSSTEGTLVAVWEHGENNNSAVAISIDDKTLNNRIGLLADGSTGLTRATSFIVTNGGVAQVSIPTGITNPSAINKMAGAYKVNDFAAVLNDGTVGTDTAGTIPTVDTVGIGSSRASPFFFLNGWIRQITYIPRRLSDAELQARTT